MYKSRLLNQLPYISTTLACWVFRWPLGSIRHSAGKPGGAARRFAWHLAGRRGWALPREQLSASPWSDFLRSSPAQTALQHLSLCRERAPPRRAARSPPAPAADWGGRGRWSGAPTARVGASATAAAWRALRGNNESSSTAPDPEGILF